MQAYRFGDVKTITTLITKQKVEQKIMSQFN